MKISQTTYNKKTRTARASVQLTKMIDYFYLNEGIAEGKFHALHGKEKSQKKWAELANELNSYQGATKTAEQWQVVWRGLKSRTSIKAKDLWKEKGLTGNKAISRPELSEFEQRVIGIIGAEYVERNNTCADSIPEQEDALEELERGNNAPLSEIPKVISVCTNISQNISEDMMMTLTKMYQILDRFYLNIMIRRIEMRLRILINPNREKLKNMFLPLPLGQIGMSHIRHYQSQHQNQRYSQNLQVLFITPNRRSIQFLAPHNGSLCGASPDAASSHKKAIVDFLQFLKTCESLRSTEKIPISTSTLTGLKVTLDGTLEILDTLKNEADWEYLMPARLNQDALEVFASHSANFFLFFARQ